MKNFCSGFCIIFILRLHLASKLKNLFVVTLNITSFHSTLDYILVYGFLQCLQEATEETIRFYLEQIDRCLTCFTADMEETQRQRSFSTLLSRLANFLFGRRGLAISEPVDDMQPRFGASLRHRKKRALVIDGRTLSYILEHSVDQLFLRLAQQCSVVLCCRATPLQKVGSMLLGY